MSNFFEDVANDASQVEEELLGPSYQYSDYIKTPAEMNMSDKGSFSALADNIGGLINYTELLVSGDGGASKTGGPLGPQFFLKTGQNCKAKDTGEMTTRYLYLDQKPTGNIPFISSGMGVDFTEFEGLVPGTMSNLNDLNPMTLFSAFTEGSNPDCQELTMETTPTDINDYQSQQTEYVTINDISAMDPCIFTLNGKTNPVTGDSCRETFSNINSSCPSKKKSNKDDYVAKIYIGALSIVGIYLLVKFMEKSRIIKFNK